MSELTGPQYFNEQQHTMHQCPQCGKQSLVQVTNTKFECIWCDFHRDLNTRRQKNNSSFFFASILTLSLTGLGWLTLSVFFPTLFVSDSISDSKPTVVNDAAPVSILKTMPEQTLKIPIVEEKISESVLSTHYPQSACGYDMAYLETGTRIIKLYPIFVDYTPAVLEEIQTDYCQDAFRHNQNGLIQVASFRSQDKANEFRTLMETVYGNAQVGAVRQRSVY